MNIKYLVQQTFFVYRLRYLKRVKGLIRNAYYRMQGMNIGQGTYLPKTYITWPHQICIGNHCILEQDIFFKYDGTWKKGPSIIIGDHTFIGSNCEFNIRESIAIGNRCLIASGSRFIDHNHSSLFYNGVRKRGSEKGISIGNNTWIGCNTVILEGVTIGDNTTIAAGSVVTESVPANEIWAGVPAKKIKNIEL
jgi:acetyltransferase-like isoleucine patch superfamily enzyme